jgi:putative oxidoreductase
MKKGSTAKVAHEKRRISAAGMRRIISATKKRWAAFHAKKAGAKKKTAACRADIVNPPARRFKMPRANLGRFEPYALSLLRLVAGFTFSLHGFQKLFGAFGGLGGHGASAHITSLLGIAGILETVGGILILAGLFTRCVAFVLCGEMAYAYFTNHAPHSLWPIANGGELAVLYCFIFVLLVFGGPGPWSLDRFVGRR